MQYLIVSMSDLAPFVLVAASLLDKVVEDLLEENKQLRAQLNANITSTAKSSSRDSMVRSTPRGGWMRVVTSVASFSLI